MSEFKFKCPSSKSDLVTNKFNNQFIIRHSLEMESPILPMEVWGNVFKYSGAKDALNFRRVCSAWRKELDTHFDKWTVRLDQHSPYLRHCLQLKVKEATILNLLSPVEARVGGEEVTPRLFKYPELLEKLYIKRPIAPDFRICPENLLLLLNSCERSIKYLDLEVGDHSGQFNTVDSLLTHTSYNLHTSGWDFRNLETLRLDLSYYRLRRCIQQPIWQHTLFNRMVGHSTMSKIKSLRIRISYFYFNITSLTILAFIQRNGRNLEAIKCYIRPKFEDGEPAQLPTSSIDLGLLRQVLRLKKIKLVYNVGYQDQQEIPWDMELVDAWSTLLQVQTNLTHLYLIGLPISTQIVRLACNNNQNTLTKCKLKWHVSFDLDLTMLADCVNLKELCVVSADDIEVDSELWNAPSLPAGLQKFESYNCFIDSEDILDFFVGHEELTEISLTRSGFHGSNGVTASVFARLVNDRNLRDKLRKIHIWGFNHSSVEELTSLNEIARSLKTWEEDMEDFRKVVISMDRKTKEEGGHWSVWGDGPRKSDDQISD